MKSKPVSLNAQLGLFTIIRSVTNVAYRMVYPLLPVFARGLGVDLTALSFVLTSRSIIAMLGVFLGPLADRYGRRYSMALGLGLVVGGLIAVVVWPSFTTFLIAMILPNLGLQLLIPAMQAYLADRLPYSQMGRAIGITETSWALSSILGIPVVAWLIDRGGWSAPFPILTVLCAAALLALLFYIPSDRPRAGKSTRIWAAFGTVLTNRVAVIALGFCLLSALASENINFIFGVWVEDSFGLQITALGAIATVIGFAELGGSTGSAWISDHIGKERAVGAGIIVNCSAALLMPVISVTVTGTAVGLFLYYISYEFLLVSSLSLMNGLHPAARATMMATVIAAIAGGRALGSLVSPWLYHFGIWGNIVAAVGVNLITLALLRWVKPVEPVGALVPEE